MTRRDSASLGIPGSGSIWCRIGFAGCLTILGGCAYYRQAVQGQWELMSKECPNSTVIASSGVDSGLGRSLQVVEELRAFASKELDLQPGRAYTQYVDLNREHVVWSIFAAPEFSLEPRRWWYPVVGRLSYRGYFTEKMARREAMKLRELGFDVYVAGVDAYSTLGWFDDPVLSTFIDYDELALAELIFHELTHKKVYLPGETEFNEALATVVAQEGVRRWLRSQEDVSRLRDYEQTVERMRAVHSRVQSARRDLEILYGVSVEDGDKTEQREKKAQIIARLRADLTRISPVADAKGNRQCWEKEELNNARLNAFATYYDYVPLLEARLADAAGDFGVFFDRTVKWWHERQ